MIFPNGYTVMLPGAVQNTPGSTTNSMKGKEGTIQGDSSKGKDVGTVAAATIPGAGIGAIADGGKGAGIGAASGGVLGLATVLLTRGPEVTLGTGDSVEMVLESTIELDPAKMHRASDAIVVAIALNSTTTKCLIFDHHLRPIIGHSRAVFLSVHQPVELSLTVSHRLSFSQPSGCPPAPMGIARKSQCNQHLRRLRCSKLLQVKAVVCLAARFQDWD